MGIGDFFGSIWNGIKTAGSWLWNNVARPVIGGIGAIMKSPFIKPLATAASAVFPQFGGAIQVAQQVGSTIGTIDDTLKNAGI